MRIDIPCDIRAEIIGNYLEGIDTEIFFLGPHKRNAYEDILSLSQDGDVIKVELARKGVYDILPEALFHPVDRFDDLPPEEYKERFADEVEKQQLEESNARTLFKPYDTLLFSLSSEVSRIKEHEYSGNEVLTEIICDRLPLKYAENRFVKRAKEFIPRCSGMRGNVSLITLMLRKVMSDEGLKLAPADRNVSFEDKNPRYGCNLDHQEDSGDLYLGNCYEDNVFRYEVLYWDEDYCDGSFLSFVEDIKVFEDFVNDFFMGIETSLHLSLSAQSEPVRLSDDLCYNYLNYNTNI